MTEGWAFSGHPPPTAGSTTVTLVEGSTFCISTSDGDVLAGAPMGLFVRDTRIVSGWVLEVDGERLDPLAVLSGDPFAATFVTRARPRPGLADSTLLVVRERDIDGGMVETLRVRNLGREMAGLTLGLRVEADFADLFEVKEGRVRPRDQVTSLVRDGGLELEHQDRGLVHGVRIVAEAGEGGGRAVEARLSPGHLAWHLAVPPRGEWTGRVTVEPTGHDRLPATYHGDAATRELAASVRRLRDWRVAAPVVHTRQPGLANTLGRSLEDLGALRIFDPDHPERAVIAAGAPWFMALFGRDALLSSWMVLPLDTSLALGTLQTLAEFQGARGRSADGGGARAHPARDAPGAGYRGVLGRQVGVLRQHRLDTAVRDAARRTASVGPGPSPTSRPCCLRPTARSSGSRRTATATGTGSWSTSAPPTAAFAIRGGRTRSTPSTSSTVASRSRRSRCARCRGTPTAPTWRGLTSPGNPGTTRCPNAGPDARPTSRRRSTNGSGCRSVAGTPSASTGTSDRSTRSTSNIGHCLWTGIVDEEHAADVARALVSPDLFSGWGVRTLAKSMGAYNPMSYHNGSVWPHDNAIIAAGLVRYGFVAEAQLVAQAVLDAAEQFGGRLPELFCGFDRAEFSPPVPYPTACSPQAWAAAAPVHLVRTLLRFDPWVPFGEVRLAPVVPERYLPLRLENVALAGTRVAVEVTESGFTVDGLDPDVLVVPEPRRASTSLLPSVRWRQGRGAHVGLHQRRDLLGDEADVRLDVRVVRGRLEDDGVRPCVRPAAHRGGHRLGVPGDTGVGAGVQRPAPLLGRQPSGGVRAR